MTRFIFSSRFQHADVVHTKTSRYFIFLCIVQLKLIYHPLYSMNNFVTNKSKLPQDGAQVFPYMG